MAARLLTLLSSAKNQRILNFLASEPAHTKAIAQALGMSDSEVSRSLRALEDAGVLESKWTRGGPAGKETNVKVYKLGVSGISVGFSADGMGIRLDRPEGEPQQPRLLVPAYSFAPPENALFVGRDDLLASASASERVIVLEGLPGVGKTALASEIARRSGRHVLWHTSTPADTPRRVLHKSGVFLSGWGDDRLLEALRGGVEDEDVLAGLTLEGLDRDDFLLVFDNYHDVQDDGAVRLLHRLFAGVRRARILVTTRRQPRFIPPEQSLRVVHLEGLSTPEVAKFLAEKGLDVPHDLLVRIDRRFGGHPLFLNFFAEAVKAGRKTVADFFDEVPEDELERYLWDELWSGLEDRERLALEHASVLEPPFPRAALEAVHADPKLPHTLFGLERKLLLSRQGPSYTMHEIVRSFAYGKLHDAKGLHGKAARFHEGEGTVEGRLLAMSHWFRAGQRKELARLLAENVDLARFDVLEQGLHLLYQEVLESFREDELPPRLWTNVLDDRADLLMARGDAAGALKLYRDVAARAKSADDAPRLADVLWKTSLAAAKLGQADEARRAVEEGLKACPEDDVACRERLEHQAAKLRPAKKRASP